MEKTIENIWKNGFLNEEALLAPKVNNLYDKKSIHLIDRYKDTFRKNIIAIVLGALFFLVISFYLDMLYAGLLFAFVLLVIAIVNQHLLNQLKQIDTSNTSYTYLKNFRAWLNRQINLNALMAQFYYPLFFVATTLGIYYTDGMQALLAQSGINALSPYWLLPLAFISALLMIFGKRIYRWDMSLIYGNMLRKLDELMQDMEELRS